LPEGTAETTDIFEIMHTMRAMRRLKPDPVPDELIRKILLAGQAAANGGNTQRWRFLVLKNHPGKKVVQGYYKKLFDEVVGPRYRNSAPPPGSDQPKQLRQMAANQYLTDHYHEAPVWIVACLEGDNPGYSSGASDLSGGREHAAGDARARSRLDPDDAAHRICEGVRRSDGHPAELPFLRDPADRLPDGAVRTGWSRAIVRNRLSRRLGQALSRNLINPISGITRRGGGLERQDALGEILREHRFGGCPQSRAPPSFRQGSDAVEDSA
jgi:nitroreductase